MNSDTHSFYKILTEVPSVARGINKNTYFDEKHNTVQGKFGSVCITSLLHACISCSKFSMQYNIAQQKVQCCITCTHVFLHIFYCKICLCAACIHAVLCCSASYSSKVAFIYHSLKIYIHES